MSTAGPSGSGSGARLAGERLEIRLDAFTAEARRREGARLSLSPAELAEFAIAYYLADLDSGRIARVPPGRADPHGASQGAV